jgi:hypothetical protein
MKVSQLDKIMLTLLPRSCQIFIKIYAWYGYTIAGYEDRPQSSL